MGPVSRREAGSPEEGTSGASANLCSDSPEGGRMPAPKAPGIWVPVSP